MSISVGAAGKVGDGVNAYYVYKVTSEMFSIDPIEVDRRYSDFFWLHGQLARQCAGYIIPPLPAKVVPLLQGTEFLERRRAGLEKFLRKVVEHDELKNTNFFKCFLECSPVELTAIKAESQKTEAGGAGATSGGSLAQMAQKSQQLNSWWGKAYQRMAENEKLRLLAAKAGRDLNSSTVIEDPEFANAYKYINELSALVRSMQSRAENAHRQNKLAAGAYCELIECMNSIADVEESLSTSSGSSASSTMASDFGAVLSLLDTRARLMDTELAEFAESVDYFTRWVGAVVNAVNVREDRRYVYQAKLAAKGKDANSNNNATQDLLEAKEAFEKVHARVMNEIQRFQAEKAVELRRMFAQYAKLQLQSTSEISDVLTTSTKALDEPVTSQQFTKRFFPSGAFGQEPDNNQTDELEEAIRKMDVRRSSGEGNGVNGDKSSVSDPLLSEPSEQYSDVSL